VTPTRPTYPAAAAASPSIPSGDRGLPDTSQIHHATPSQIEQRLSSYYNFPSFISQSQASPPPSPPAHPPTTPRPQPIASEMLGVARRRLGSGCVSALPPPGSPPSPRSHRDPFPSPQVLAQLAQALRPAAVPARTYSAAAKEVSATVSSRPPRVASLRVCRVAEYGDRFVAGSRPFPLPPIRLLVCQRSGRLALRCDPCRASPIVLSDALLFLRLRNSLLATRFSKPFFFPFLR
jgi:hypothetical protein